MNEPHGGKLINRMVEKKELDLGNIDLTLEVDRDQAAEIKNIATGVYSPLEGYMNEDDFQGVIKDMKLANGVVWSVPIFLPVSASDAKKVKNGSQVLLKTKEEGEVAVLMVESVFEYNKDEYCKSVYGTNDKEHPGVAMISELPDHAIGGKLSVFGEITSPFPDFEMTPEQTRAKFEKMGWETIVGFQTRNPAHRAHEYIQKLCLEFVDGIFVNPIIGKKKPGDFKDEVILKVYKELMDQYYPPKSSLVGIYSSRMNYAGPKEAVFHAIARKNFGCTHFIVGRDHAGVGDYYDPMAAHEIFSQVDVGVEIMKVSASFFCRRCQIFTTAKICPHNNIYHVSPSGTQVREYIQEHNYENLRHIMRDEVLDVIFSFNEPFVE